MGQFEPAAYQLEGLLAAGIGLIEARIGNVT